jgi:predicted DCC family thiol-disulfide oxidoreductase YuxK
MAEQAIILFDGVCNFCNGMVGFIIRHDPEAYFKFGALQSDEGQRLLKEFGLLQTDLDTLILIEDGRAFTHSTAVLKICRHLSGGWSIFYDFIVVPQLIRDPLYYLFAKIRYRIFGKRKECRVPTNQERARFITHA